MLARNGTPGYRLPVCHRNRRLGGGGGGFAPSGGSAKATGTLNGSTLIVGMSLVACV